MRRLLLGFLVGLLLLPVAVFLGGWLGLLPSYANTDPPAWEAAFGQMALEAYVARHAPHVTNPLPATDANLKAGMDLFLDACAGCHDSGFGATFYPHAPQFAAAPPDMPDWQLFWLVNHGVRYSGMSAWDSAWNSHTPGMSNKAYSDQKVWLAVTFLSHLKSLPPALASAWQHRAGH